MDRQIPSLREELDGMRKDTNYTLYALDRNMTRLAIELKNEVENVSAVSGGKKPICRRSKETFGDLVLGPWSSEMVQAHRSKSWTSSFCHSSSLS